MFEDLKKLFKFLSSKNRRVFIGVVLFAFLMSAFEALSILLITFFITLATNFSIIYHNSYCNSLYKIFHFASPRQFVVYVGIILMIFYTIYACLQITYIYVNIKFTEMNHRAFMILLFEHYLKSNYLNFISENSSKINQFIFNDTSTLMWALASVVTFLTEGTMVISIYIVLIWMQWKMTLLLTFILGIEIFLLLKFFSKRVKDKGVLFTQYGRKTYNIYNESYGNFKLIKLFCNEGSLIHKFTKSTRTYVEAIIMNTTLQGAPRFILELVGFFIIVIIVFYVIYCYIDTSIAIPIISMYALAFFRLLPAIEKITRGFNQVNYCSAAIRNVSNFFAVPQEKLGDKKVNFQHTIKLQNISFGYNNNPNSKLILQNVNCIIDKGQRVAFIGESGSGKSSLLDLIMGLYLPQEGSILIDDVVLSNKNMKSWRSKIGYIPQMIYLFDGTVADNIVFGRHLNEANIIVALQRANIYDFLCTKDGIQTVIGEGGIKLNGGQKQRIAIARALYDDPELLILDEATSALDPITESKIMHEIYALEIKKTLIIVAHRLNTIELCDVIYKIEQGSIFQQR
jgi:ATP-binding cassette, subfamily B, bacterial PglK